MTKRSGHSNCASMAAVMGESREMSIKQLHPDTQWIQVWKILHTAWLSEEITSILYIVVHDIVPTNKRLHVIRVVESDLFGHRGRRDTLANGLTECNDGTAIWLWTGEIIAQKLRTDTRRLATYWCLRPDFLFWPPERHKGILWLVAYLVMYRLSSKDTYHCPNISTSCVAHDGRHARRPAGCRRWETIFPYSRECPLYRREPKEEANRCQDGTRCEEGDPPHTPLEWGCASVSATWHFMGNALPKYEAETMLISYV